VPDGHRPRPAPDDGCIKRVAHPPERTSGNQFIAAHGNGKRYEAPDSHKRRIGYKKNQEEQTKGLPHTDRRNTDPPLNLQSEKPDGNSCANSGGACAKDSPVHDNRSVE